MVRAVVASVLAVAVGGCGAPQPPTAPKAEVTDAVYGIVTPCGEAHMVLATGGPPGELRRLDRRALPFAGRLVALARREPQAVYLGSSMAALVQTQRSAAAACHLIRTARRLR